MVFHSLIGSLLPVHETQRLHHLFLLVLLPLNRETNLNLAHTTIVAVQSEVEMLWESHSLVKSLFILWDGLSSILFVGVKCHQLWIIFLPGAVLLIWAVFSR